jgi:hypothetical protein
MHPQQCSHGLRRHRKHSQASYHKQLHELCYSSYSSVGTRMPAQNPEPLNLASIPKHARYIKKFPLHNPTLSSHEAPATKDTNILIYYILYYSYMYRHTKRRKAFSASALCLSNTLSHSTSGHARGLYTLHNTQEVTTHSAAPSKSIHSSNQKFDTDRTSTCKQNITSKHQTTLLHKFICRHTHAFIHYYTKIYYIHTPMVPTSSHAAAAFRRSIHDWRDTQSASYNKAAGGKCTWERRQRNRSGLAL